MPPIRKPIDPELALQILLQQQQEPPAPAPAPPQPAPPQPGPRPTPEIPPDISEYQQRRAQAIDRIVQQAQWTAGQSFVDSYGDRDMLMNRIRKDPANAGNLISKIPGFNEQPAGAFGGEELAGRQKMLQELSGMSSEYSKMMGGTEEARLQQMLSGNQKSKLQSKISDLKNLPTTTFSAKEEEAKQGTQGQILDLEKRMSGLQNPAEPYGSTPFKRKNIPGQSAKEMDAQEQRFGDPEKVAPKEDEELKKAQAYVGQGLQQEEDEVRYGQRVSEDRKGILDELEKAGAEQYAQEESDRMVETPGLPPQETPVERYLRMLTEPVQDKAAGPLDVLAVLGQSLGGAKPDQINSTIDSLRGGPQRRQNLGQAGTAAQIYSGREEAKANRDSGILREGIEQTGRVEQEKARSKGAMDLETFRQGKMGERQTADISSREKIEANKLTGKDKGPSVSDIISLIRLNEDAYDPAQRALSTELGATMGDENMRMGQPDKYMELLLANLQNQQGLEESRFGGRAELMARLQSGDPMLPYQRPQIPSTYKDMIARIQQYLAGRQVK